MIQLEKIESINASTFWTQANKEMFDKYPDLVELGKTEKRVELEKEFQIVIKQKEKEYLKRTREVQKRNFKAIVSLSKSELKDVFDNFVKNSSYPDWCIETMIEQGAMKCKVKREGKGHLVHKGTIIEGIQSHWIVSYEFGIIKGGFDCHYQSGKLKEEWINRQIFNEIKNELL